MTTPDAFETRDRLRALFDRLGIPARVEVGTFGVHRSIVIAPLRPEHARLLVAALGGPDGCAHPALEKRGGGGTWCATCHVQIYLPNGGAAARAAR